MLNIKKYLGLRFLKLVGGLSILLFIGFSLAALPFLFARSNVSRIDFGSVEQTIDAGKDIELFWITLGEDIKNVDLSYSLDDGVEFSPITEDITGDSYTWSIPATMSGKVIFMVDGKGEGGGSIGTDTYAVTVREYLGPENEIAKLIRKTKNLRDEPLGITLDSRGRKVAPYKEEKAISPFSGKYEPVSEVHAGQFIRSYVFPTVYFITEDMERRPIWDSVTYFSWMVDWDEVVWVTDATLVTLPLVEPMLPNLEATLVKIKSDPKVYRVLNSDDGEFVLRWISSEDLMVEMYGEDWADYVIDLDPGVFGRYKMGKKIQYVLSVDKRKLKTRVSLTSH